MNDIPEAQEVVLKSFRPHAPPFHKHIVKNKLLHGEWKAGDRLVVYDIVSTAPGGTVRVTEQTLVRFEPVR